MPNARVRTFYFKAELNKNPADNKLCKITKQQSVNILVSVFSVVDVHVMRENSILAGAIRLIFLLNGI